jgi:hypothetical protein
MWYAKSTNIMKRFWGSVLFLVLAAVPLLSYAAGLVPCGGPEEPACQTCHVVQLVNGVISWLVLILGTVAAIIIVYAGFKLVTSGGNRHAKEDAKSMISNMIIGYTIVLAGWLLVDTGMKALLLDGETKLGMWNQLSCVVQPVATSRTYTPSMFQPNTSIPGPSIPGTGGSIYTGNQRLACTLLPNGADNCIPQQDECREAGGIPIIDSSAAHRSVICSYRSGGGGGGADSGGGGSRPPDLSASGACSPAIIGRHFPSPLIGAAQCIIRAESSCGGRMVSITDVMSDGRAFSFGPMQINLTVHTLQGCGSQLLDCKSAFAGKNYSARVINEDMYQKCAAAAQNVDCNIKNGFRIYREAGNRWTPWSTAASCRL